MIHFVLPSERNKKDVLSFYQEIVKAGGECIGLRNHDNYDLWLEEMTNRHLGRNLPDGYVRENFYLCYDRNKLVGVFSLKFELTDFLLHFGGHIGYAVRPSERRKGYATKILKEGLFLAKEFGFDKVLCICNEDNVGSEKTILKNGGILENVIYDPEEKLNVKRYWIKL